MPIALLLAITGSAGVLTGSRRVTGLSSAALLSFLIWGKMATDLFKTSAPDSALFLAEFTLVLFLMEASSLILEFDKVEARLKTKDDELSQESRRRLAGWLRKQLSRQGKLALATIGLSVALLPLAGITSIPNNQLVLSSVLVLVVVVVLLFLVTQGREPERG